MNDSKIYYEWRLAPKADYAVIGDPVHHSLSPKMQTAALRVMNRKESYLAIHVKAGEFEQALDYLTEQGYRGVNITVPHKEAAFRWCNSIDPLSQKIGAVNTVLLKPRVGMNSDAPGLLEVLEFEGKLGSKRGLILGAGGTARAAVVALKSQNIPFDLCNRTRERAESLLSDLKISANIVEDAQLSDYDFLLNTTSASLQNTSLNLNWKDVKKDCLAFDFAYGQETTVFMKEAERAGCFAIDGRRLLIAQGAISLAWWLGVPKISGGAIEAMKNAVLVSR